MAQQQKQLNLQRPRIFLSYAKEDEGKVKSFYRKLLNERLNPWLDLTDLAPGQDWDKAIISAIRNARFVIVFLSNHSVNKRGYVQKEIGEALDVADRMPEGELFIIPVRLEDCVVPQRLSKWQWIDVFRPGGFKTIVNTIKVNLGLNEDSSISLGNRKREKQISKDDLFDLLLTKLFPFGGEFLHTRIDTGQVVISNGHFMEFREKLPKILSELKRDFGHSRKLTSQMISTALPQVSSYRKDSHLLKEIKTLESEKSAYVLVSKGNIRCGVYKEYMHYIQLKYPNHKIYLGNESSAIVVEENEKVCFVVMPFYVNFKKLTAA